MIVIDDVVVERTAVFATLSLECPDLHMDAHDKHDAEAHGTISTLGRINIENGSPALERDDLDRSLTAK